MSSILFAKPHEIIQPKGGDLILEEQHELDYVLGGLNPRNLGEVLVEDGDWTKYDTLWELQRNALGWDNFSCVTYSLNKVHQFIIKKKYGVVVNFSDRFVSVGSGTLPGRGNGIKAVAEWKRKNGYVWEDECPFTPDMGETEFYAKLNPVLFTKAAVNRDTLYGSNYMWLGGSSNEDMKPGLQVSPIQAAVETPYIFNSKDEIINAGNSYNHAICIAAIMPDGSRAIRDSETQQWLKFSPTYSFLSTMVHFVEKKTPIMKKYQIKGDNSVFGLHPVLKGLFPYLDGDVYKASEGTVGYEGITILNSLSELLAIAPLLPWGIGKQAWDIQAFKNKFN